MEPDTLDAVAANGTFDGGSPVTDMLDRLIVAKAVVDGEQDNLLEAMAMLAASGHISIIPQSERLTTRPVIMLPQRMYDRMLEIIPSHDGEGQSDGSE